MPSSSRGQLTLSPKGEISYCFRWAIYYAYSTDCCIFMVYNLNNYFTCFRIFWFFSRSAFLACPLFCLNGLFLCFWMVFFSPAVRGPAGVLQHSHPPSRKNVQYFASLGLLLYLAAHGMFDLGKI